MNVTKPTASVFLGKKIHGTKKTSTKDRLKKRKIKVRRY